MAKSNPQGFASLLSPSLFGFLFSRLHFTKVWTTPSASSRPAQPADSGGVALRIGTRLLEPKLIVSNLLSWRVLRAEKVNG